MAKVKIPETHLIGIPISQGIAIGKPYFYTFIEDEVHETQISSDAVEYEIERYLKAVEHCKKDIRQLQDRLNAENALEAVAILETHIQMIDDPLITNKVLGEIRSKKKNADFVFKQITQEYHKKLDSMSDIFFKERAMDLQDITRRVVSYLCEERYVNLVDIPENTIIFARELAASGVAEVKTENVRAFVTESGGATSHAAIVAKAKGIPYIGNIDFTFLEKIDVELAIVDGRRGDIILNPNSDTLKKYKKLQEALHKKFEALEKDCCLKSETKDGHRVAVSANIEMAKEIPSVHKYGGHGVGLFRSEYIFLAQYQFPSEEEQFAIYKNLVIQMDGCPIVIRTFDVGGDKLSVLQHTSHKGNPYLGARAIRFLLQEKEVFKTQLRAILRSTVYGDVRILFPMISGLGELLEAKKILEECKYELLQQKIPIAESTPIGCMIEVPSAAVIADLLAEECDFLSIGTNDLVQYTLAADRSNQSQSVQYTPTHPAVIRLIKSVVDFAKQADVPVGVCGEVAADPKFTPLLLGLGIDELSVSSRYIPAIKHTVRSFSKPETQKIAERALMLKTPEEVESYLAKIVSDEDSLSPAPSLK